MYAHLNTESLQFLLGTCDVPLIDISFVPTSQSFQSPQSTVMNAFQLSPVCDDLCRSGSWTSV